MSSTTLRYAKNLLERESTTPEDAGCQDWLGEKLSAIGFDNEPMLFGEVKNLWSRFGKADNGKPIFVFAGHTDVVPTGPLEKWNTPPFTPTEKDGFLFARGAADMKSSIAAMVVACEQFLSEIPEPNINLGFLITADEEGPAHDGTVKVIETLEARNEKIDWCLVGEPTATDTVGDVVKNGRRGSLNATLTIHGKQGHVAYPQLAKNPIHLMTKAIDELVNTVWDNGNDFFPPTSMQISNINAGTGATNVTPGDCKIVFNFRFSTEQTETKLRNAVEALLDKHKLSYTIDWALSGNPFLTDSGALVEAAQTAIKKSCGLKTELSTSGGTSDGRFIAPTGAQVLELGPTNATIHQVNECTHIGELETLTDIYLNILRHLHQTH